MRPAGPAEAPGSKGKAHLTSAPQTWFKNADNPDFQDKDQNDGKWIGRLTSLGQCAIGRETPLHKCMLTLHILTSNRTEKEP